MQVYNYDPETFEYVGESEAALDPMGKAPDGGPRFLMPAFSTAIAPPEEAPGFIRVFDEGVWHQEAIHAPPVDVNEQIRNAPTGLFGGPTLGEPLNVHQ